MCVTFLTIQNLYVTLEININHICSLLLIVLFKIIFRKIVMFVIISGSFFGTVFEERLCCSFTNNFTAEIVLKINRMKLGTHRLAEAECKPSTLFMLSINTYLLKESIKSLQLSMDGSRSACYRSLSIGHSSIRY